ncbi:hypothetical protein J5N97_017589 [Dioscorea zingiberensis]|uniref:Structural maintenance of chromosomes protein 5 n=1 Tax=Dioscorea zingiberensis TaxID=325984 RepID=A0A9D5CMQ4_9LILI|nr:hypothetical protein J5N97_017589 [Dioscorea zingiberensis]
MIVVSEDNDHLKRCLSDIEMAVAGEVSLDEHQVDFDKFGILIKVKFRQTGQLQVLSAHHQSGGEHSVSTILYLVSLQDLTNCPFCVVDEINQGKLPKNMDPINGRKIFQQLVRAASQPSTPQCFLLTPKLLPDLEYSDACSILNIMNGPWIEEPSKVWSSGDSWEDEELITNALETIVNLAPLLDLLIFSSSKPSFITMTEKHAVQAIMGMLGSSIKAWHCAAAELLGRLIINPDNEPFLLPFAPQIYKRLVDLLSLQAVDAQAAAIEALYNLSEVNMDCRLKLASERWAVDRLLKIVRTPHPVPEVCRKAAMILESLVSEPQNRVALLAHESTFAEILLSDGKFSDIFARILYELTSRPSNKVAITCGVWGM